MVVDQGLPSSGVAKHLGIPYTTVTSWVTKYRKGGRGALQQLALPIRDLVGMHIVQLRQLRQRLLASDGIYRHLGLEQC